MVVGFTGALRVVLGVVFWARHALNLIPIHMGIGFLFVAALLALSVLGLRAGAPRGMVAFAFAWALVIPVFGMAQAQILPGSLHWVIRVLHLLVG